MARPRAKSARNNARNNARQGIKHAQANIAQMHSAASAGTTWLNEMTEQNLNQGIAAVNGLMTTVRASADAIGRQASRVRETSEALAVQTMGNATELGNRLSRSRHPLEWIEAHSEFMSRQAQAMVGGAQTIGAALVDHSTEGASAGLNQMRKASRKGSRAARGNKG